MKLTKLERVMLINQYRILSKINPNEANYYEELIEILENGYSVFYSMIDDFVYDEAPVEEGKFVLDILQLYRMIDDYIRDNEEHPFKEHHWIPFKGFDGNNEFRYMSFARFLILNQGKFTEQKKFFSANDSLNSHTRTVDKYRRMMDRWEECDDKYNLSEEDISQILDA